MPNADGTPFFWLGDTWWMGLTKRLRWPEDFQALAADRRQKGFSVVQIVAGLYPDMPNFDPRGFNEAGSAWEPGFRSINPTYFDMADARIHHLVDSGFVPCVVGCWGYFLPQMGIRKIKQHWRYLVARWGALPVVWCLAGEGTMPYYLSKTPKEWVEPHWSKTSYMQPYAAGIPGELRIVFMPPMWNPPKIKILEAGRTYSSLFFNPSDGSVQTVGEVTRGAEGDRQVPNPPTFQDWVLVMRSG